jgi:hypothetical protein
MYPPSSTNTSSESGSVASMSGDRLRRARSVALYGVRVSTIGALRAPFGTTMTVWSLTPSRIGIMTSRLS